MRFRTKDLAVRVVGEKQKLRMLVLADDCPAGISLTGCDTECTVTENCDPCTCDTGCTPTSDLTYTRDDEGCLDRCEALTEVMGFQLKMIGELMGAVGEPADGDLDQQIAELDEVIQALRGQQESLRSQKDDSKA